MQHIHGTFSVSSCKHPKFWTDAHQTAWQKCSTWLICMHFEELQSIHSMYQKNCSLFTPGIGNTQIPQNANSANLFQSFLFLLFCFLSTLLVFTSSCLVFLSLLGVHFLLPLRLQFRRRSCLAAYVSGRNAWYRPSSVLSTMLFLITRWRLFDEIQQLLSTEHITVCKLQSQNIPYSCIFCKQKRVNTWQLAQNFILSFNALKCLFIYYSTYLD